MKRGVVFTLEAIISFLFFFITLFSILILIGQKERTVPLYEMVLLNDIYQILELKYHYDLSLFARTGLVSIELKDYLDYVKSASGYTVILEFGNNRYISSGFDCEPIIKQKRLLVYFDLQLPPDVNYFHELNIGLCK